jgi:hypothetical protein
LLPQGGDERPLDLLICAPNSKLPAKPLVRTKFEVSESAPAKDTPVEVLRANPDQPLVKDAGAEWSRLRVQRDASWPVGAGRDDLAVHRQRPGFDVEGGRRRPTHFMLEVPRLLFVATAFAGVTRVGQPLSRRI